MSACPTEITLRRLGAGVLGEKTFAGIEEHVESCEICRQFLQAVVRDDLQRPVSDTLPGEEAMPDVPGFFLERELGRGSNGVVFLARETAIDRPVALKILSDCGVSEARSHGVRLTEAKAVSRLRHPNIVQLYQVLEVLGGTVLVLEYLPGGTLKDRLSGPLAPQEAARILETIAEPVGYIHKAGLVHLDIKPSNILVDGDPGCALDSSVLKVSDFGIALSFAEPATTPNGQAGPRGTPAYMAPEQTGTTEVPIGPAADVYALGSLLYHLLTGRPPFQSPSARETLELIGTVEPVPPRSLNPRIPRNLEIICLHCLRKAPERRYPSADALADDLRRFLDGRPIAVRPASSVEHVASWCRRRPAIAVLAATLALTIFASLTGLTLLLKRSESDRFQAVAARERAEENEAMASRTLEELEAWIQQVLNDPIVLQDQHLAALIDDTKHLTENLHGDGESILRMIATVSMLQRDLASKLAVRPDKLPDASRLLTRSRQHLTDCLQRKPDAEMLQTEFVLTLLDSGLVAFQQNAFRDAEDYFADVAALVPTMKSQELRVRLLFTVSEQRRSMAFRDRILGNHDAASRVLSADYRMFNSVSPADAGLPELRLNEALTLSALGRRDEAIPALRDLVQRGPGEWLRPGDCQVEVRRWIGMDVVDSLLGERIGSPHDDATEIEQQSGTLIDLIQRQARAIGLQEVDVPAIALAATRYVQLGCAAKRREHKIDQSGEIVRRFVAFSDQLAAAFPEHAVAQVVLGEAHLQVAKTAWERRDNHEAVDALHKALGAAQRAARLNPQLTDARLLIDGLELKLAKAERERMNLVEP